MDINVGMATIFGVTIVALVVTLFVNGSEFKLRKKKNK